MNVKIFVASLSILLLSGCVTLYPSGSSFLGNQVLISSLAHEATVIELSQQYENFEISPISFLQDDGNESLGIVVAKPDAKYTILYLGPNNFPIHKHHRNVLPYLNKLDANLIWVDYRGFGFTSGLATIDRLKKDSMNIFKLVKHSSNLPTVLHGLSIGSILAINVAATTKVDFLVLEASVTNVTEWIDIAFVNEAKFSYGIPAPIGYIIKPFIKIEPQEDVLKIQNSISLNMHAGKLLMLTGEKDWETPPSINNKLFDSIRDKKHSQIHTIENVGHLDLLSNPRSIDLYRAFLKGL
ncbi:hypothetical protein VT06_16270 [Arsukibacterium sp. MJ3]|uniref:alpha/beta hydrolase n=1 Tax=Arsukibacterium sp. MJ3 TaxID=1632859 RepID=UPI00062740F9|nr:alpha/beta hydrolase [Arsukibacterium sp. MJ3]KKO47578.1 hypothetical protein VT06_16270 [Arsukibacterium sp. MJ3]